MNEDLKFVLNRVNNKLGIDLNIISINSLSSIEILQLVNKTMHNIGICSLVPYDGNPETIIFVIIETLQKIKYNPSSEMSPEQFREGLVTGNLSVIIPLLTWLLQDENEVSKRAYLSKYVDKIEVPVEIRSDPIVAQIYQQYESQIEEFWRTYSIHKKEKKIEEETVQLKKDIERMDDDLLKLMQRTAKQKEKVDNIPQHEALLALSKNYTKESMEEKKLQEQISTLRATLGQMENQIKVLTESIAIRKMSKPLKDKPLEYIESEFKTNQLLAEEELPKEYEKLNTELGILETVVNEPEPLDEDLESISEEIEKLQLEIQDLNEKKLSLLQSNSNILRPYQNQASVLENRKQELSKSVMKMKENLNELNKILAEKQDKLISDAGGPILHGEELRNYVSQLRELSEEYKEKKLEYQSLFSELGIASRTFEVLTQNDPNILKIMEDSKLFDDFEAKGESEEVQDEQKLRKDFLQLMQEASKFQAEVKQHKEDLSNTKQEYEEVNEKYQMAKDEFERKTGYEINELEKYKTEMTSYEEEIQNLEEKWISLKREIDRKEELLIRLSEDMITSANDDEEDDETGQKLTHLQKLEKKLQEKEKIKMNLISKKEESNSNMDEDQEQLEIMNTVVQLLKCKRKYLDK